MILVHFTQKKKYHISYSHISRSKFKTFFFSCTIWWKYMNSCIFHVLNFQKKCFSTALKIGFTKTYKHTYIRIYIYSCVWLFWGKESVTSPWGAMTSCIWTGAILVSILQGIFIFGSVLQRSAWSAEHLQHWLPSLAFTQS